MVLIHHGLDHGPLLHQGPHHGPHIHNGPHHGPHIHHGLDHGPQYIMVPIMVLIHHGSASLKKNAVYKTHIIF